MATTELRSIYSGPVRRAFDRLDRMFMNGSAGNGGAAVPGNALGIVAMGTMNTSTVPLVIPSNTTANITAPLVFTTQIGRRYRIVTKVRAIHPTSMNVASGVYFRTSGNGLASNDTHVVSQYQFESLEHVVIFNGTGIEGTYLTTITTGGATGQNVYTDQPSSFFYIEDVGPVR